MNVALQKLFTWLHSRWGRAGADAVADAVIVPPATTAATALPLPSP